MGTRSGLCRECSARRDGSYTYTKDVAIQTSDSHVATMRHEPGYGSNVDIRVYTYTFSSKTHRNLFIHPCLHFLNYPSTSNYSMKARTFPPFVHAHRAAEIGSHLYLAHTHPRPPARAYLHVVQVHQSLGHLPCPSTSR